MTTNVLSNSNPDNAKFFLVLVFLVISDIGVCFILYAWGNEGFIAPELSLISFISLEVFLCLCYVGFQSVKCYFFAFPIVLLSVPNAVNDLLPSYLMGPAWERNSAYFSFFTHVDLYLFLGVLRFFNVIRLKQGFLFLIISFIILVFFVTHLFFYLGTNYLGPFFFGLYQVRYFLLLLPIVSIFRIEEDFKFFFLGICLAVLLLVVESFLTTYMRSGGVVGIRLGSGNFSVNVYGNLLAGLSLFLYWGGKVVSLNVVYRLCVFFCLIMSVCALFLTGTRGAVFSLALSFFLLTHFSGFKGRHNGLFFYCIGGIVFLIGSYYAVIYSQDLLSSDFYNDDYVYTEGGSSLNTRIVLWEMTLQMISDNFFIGIGNGTWNYLKYDYDSPFSVLLDPHNDYLSYLVNYGMLGLVALFFCYFFPLYRVIFKKRLAGEESNFDVVLNNAILSFIIPLSISAFTNANTLKHQVFVLFLFFVLNVYRNKLYGRGSEV